MSFHETRKWRARLPLSIGFGALAVLVGVIGLWAVQARIAGAVIAPGRIEVESNRQVVQHLQGGVVNEIFAKNGDWVEGGDVLLRLDGTLMKSELAIVEGQLFEILARKARLEAERDGRKELSPIAELSEAAIADPKVRSLLAGQEQLFAARAETVERELDQISEQIIQTENQIEGTAAQLSALGTQADLIAQELSDAQTLLDKGLIQASRVLALQREQARLRGEIGRLKALISQLRGEIVGLDIQKLRIVTTRREEAITNLRDLEYRVTELAEKRRATLETLSRLDIRAPVSGVVMGSQVFALQSVISPAEPLMYLIPQGQPLIVKVRIDAIHIDQVHIDQPVTLRFSAFDQRQTPELSGVVSRLSADVYTDERSGLAYYEAELTPNPGELEKLGEQTLVPGMPVEAFIKTAELSPLDYLTKPLTDYFARAFR